MMRFQRTIDMGRFIINTFLKLPIEENQYAVCQWKRMYCTVGLSEEELAAMQQSAKEVPYYIVCQSATHFDRALAQYYKQ